MSVNEHRLFLVISFVLVQQPLAFPGVYLLLVLNRETTISKSSGATPSTSNNSVKKNPFLLTTSHVVSWASISSGKLWSFVLFPRCFFELSPLKYLHSTFYLSFSLLYTPWHSDLLLFSFSILPNVSNPYLSMKISFQSLHSCGGSIRKDQRHWMFVSRGKTWANWQHSKPLYCLQHTEEMHCRCPSKRKILVIMTLHLLWRP